ncbi:hypothetical protein B0A55_02200 [Friedmanniomyces simplex]|uniref:Uncharacterized protein n=1 Tax=Friedmanniomyces simplex TaxID=329884 RepID=A0A4U0XWP9_9PEZI|nr:hypothetical protein B0A55_02200 [Friedmanniomyces simplex]
MLDIASHNGPKPKCYFIHAALSSFVDYDHPPAKKRPFSTFAAQTTSHTVDILLTESSLQEFRDALAEGKGTFQYARVHMKLSEIIEGDFFNHYVKAGLLRLEVDKATYERMGLEGKALAGEGRKHVKARFAVEINLRLPSMVRGKPGFDRVVWAFRNVLNRSVTWLFHDLKAETDGSGPIAVHQPLVRNLEPVVERLDGVVMYPIPEVLDQDDHSTATELLEWITMVASLSPRLQRDDSVDPYLSKYHVAGATGDGHEGGTTETQDLARIRWHGFTHASFVSGLFMTALKACGDDWFAVSATSFRGEAYTTLKTGERTLTWEYME